MASNENFQSHYSQTPPSPTLKTHPTRRRIIRKSPRSSIRLSTLKKSSTIPSGNDSSSFKPQLLQESSFGDHDFHRFNPNPLRTMPTSTTRNEPIAFKQSSSKSSSRLYEECALSGSNVHEGGCDPVERTSTGAPGGPGCEPAALLRLFSCAGCGGVLRQPVTLECGHTCCKGCAVERCPDCGLAVDRVQCVNVLVRSIMNKLVGDRLQEKGEIFIHFYYSLLYRFFICKLVVLR